MTESETNLPPQGLLRFRCPGCGYGLEAASTYAGVEAPCPVCGSAVQAPMRPETAVVTLPDGFWDETPVGTEVLGSGGSTVERACLPQTNQERTELEVNWEVPAPPVQEKPSRSERKHVPGPTREEEEAAAESGHRQRQHRLRFFDAALMTLFLGTLVMGGAALAFTQAKPESIPSGSPELSGLVVERMQQLDRQRDQAVQTARQTLQGLLAAGDAKSAEPLLLPGSPAADGLVFPCFPGAGPDAFEFIQVRRIPGTDRFLSLFEIVSAPPLVIPVEETAAGTRVHGLALAQQQGGRLGKFLATQGQGEEVFYVLLRPGPAPMAAELVRSRPDLQLFQLVAAEPAFPADGASGCLVCLTPGSEAAAIFAKRSHDSGLRPAVVKLAWRQHRESGNYIELLSFQPNSWSRH